MSKQLADEHALAAPTAWAGGRTRGDGEPAPHLGVEETTLPPDYQRSLAAVRQAAGPAMARQVGDAPGIDVSRRSKPEPPRGKLVKLVDRSWLRKLPDGRFTTRL
ncbi:hypothetical protein ACIRPR_15910 [Streptomyces griseoflavus]|uniref:hypothetical protein n=1 Tax=Streptomyces griseoflavus TaxID=35619 RepID=UPI0019915D29|nr:hypothetical protein [Streptomyces griseoflavus]GGV43563.1 hypothetical protein GCM10010293_50240 [Streptomyces griseoflavus]